MPRMDISGNHRAGCGSVASIILLLLSVLSEAQVRTWGFSRDAVHEWAPNRDTVSLANQAADTLKFDTAWLELLAPASDGLWVHFVLGTGISAPRYALNTPSTTPRGVNPRHIVVPPFQAVMLSAFFIDADAAPLARRAAYGDTLRARMILRTASRGSDTLILNGTQQTMVGIHFRPDPWNRKGGDDPGARFFDLLGRRVEPVREGARVPAAPVLAPKE